LKEKFLNHEKEKTNELFNKINRVLLLGVFDNNIWTNRIEQSTIDLDSIDSNESENPL
jgi:hypothetical protein